jgi:adenylosuccinate synthase
MMVNPSTLWNEAMSLERLGGIEAPYDLLTVERGALLTTPPHMYANQIRESMRGEGRHGSCGLGIGETMAYSLKYPDDAPRVGDLEKSDLLKEKVELLVKRLSDDLGRPLEGWHSDSKDRFYGRCELITKRQCLVDSDYLPEVMRKRSTVFEGAQGVLLDQDYGFHPYTTWSNTTLENAMTLIKDYEGDVTRMGITRSYLTRHGPGPFPSYVPAMNSVSEAHNAFGEWQRDFRRGYLDLILLRYALEVVGGVDEIAMTHMDWVFRDEVQWAVTDYKGIDYSTSEVFEWDDFLCMPRIRVRKYDTMEEQMGWQSKVTQALETITSDGLTITRHFKSRNPEGTIKGLLMSTGSAVTLLSHGPTHEQKQRVHAYT